MKANQSVVYAIRNLSNGKRYIGSSANFTNRKKKHLADLRRGRHHSVILQNAYAKYGEAAFVFEVIESVPNVADLLKREQFYLDSQVSEYNVSRRANEKTRLGMKSSPEHTANMSAAMMGRPGTNKGKTFSAEHRRKIGEANKGKGRPAGFHRSEETKQKLRDHHNPASDLNLKYHPTNMKYRLGTAMEEEDDA